MYINNESITIDTQEILSDINIYDKYARHLDKKNRRENWNEICDRVEIMHTKKFPQLKEEIHQSILLVRDKKILPSMRTLQFAGLPVEISPARSYNCSYAIVDNYKVFGEAMFLLLSGCGFGYSVQKHHVEKLNPIRKPIKSRRYLIADSIEGWADAVHHLVKSYLNGSSKPIFDFRGIRPKGSRLVTAGGKAPGAAPLKICLANIEAILESKKDGEQLKSIECHDIICHIANAVMAGGIRRASCISLFSFDDEEMLHCKHGNWWELNPQRGRANNSVVLVKSKLSEVDFKNIWKIIELSKSGEPGLFMSNDPTGEMGANPCCEISLKPMQFCNLCEVNTSNIVSQEDLNNRVRAATLLATIQASYTDFHYLRSQWKTNSEKDALIGIGLTGIADGALLEYNLKEAAEIVKKENERIAKLIGINIASRTTCVKPSGNSSVVLGSSSGIHSRFSPYYWRRMKIEKSSSLYTYLKINAEDLLEEDLFDKSMSFIKVAVKSPKNSITRHNETPLDVLERIKKVYTEWITFGHRKGINKNNISATVYVKDNEWEVVGKWLWENRDNYTGISFLPYDNGTYVQTPYEECTEDDYNNFINKIKNINIDLDNVVEYDDTTNLSGENACGGGKCELS